MKLITSILIFVCLINPLSNGFTQEIEFPILKGPYLGQKPPGIIPELFAPGVISTMSTEGCSAFNEDGTIFLFKRNFPNDKNYIFITELKNGVWTNPVIAPFESEYYDGDFTFAPDGRTLYLSSRRPLGNLGKGVQSNIWKIILTSDGWTEPQQLEYPVNTDKHESYPSVSNNGNLYYFCRDRGGLGKSDIFISKLEDGIYKKIENLGKIINTNEDEWDPYIAPDESYMIFCSTKQGGFGQDDFYVSFRTKSNIWTKPVNMGDEINSAGWDNRPYVTIDGRYFFFTSTKSGIRNIYWVDAKIIDKYKPDYLK